MAGTDPGKLPLVAWGYKELLAARTGPPILRSTKGLATMKRGGFDVHGWILAVLALCTAGLVIWTVQVGLDYYGTPLVERPHHPDYRDLRPAGRVGHGLGILGSLMICLLLLYTLRKRAAWLARRGSLGTWLRYHIFMGVAGPVLITLHTSFKVEGLVAWSYWSMVAVAVSGVFGRYLYQQIPRNVLGEALSLDELEARNEAILVDLSETVRLDDWAVGALETLALDRLERLPSAVALFALPWSNLFLARRLQIWRRGLATDVDTRGLDLARTWVLQARRIHLHHLIRDIFHWWHVVHKPFAIIMILVMLVHVAVSLALGYTWLP